MSMLRIRFDGLCAFVSNTANGNGNGSASHQDKEMMILLVDARHHESMKHLPRFAYAGANLHSRWGTPNTNPWELEGENLVISMVSADGVETRLSQGGLHITRDKRIYFADPHEPANAFPTDETELEDFSWIPSMKQIDSSFRLNGALFDGSVPLNLIAGRLHLTAGTIKVASLIMDPDHPGEIAAFEFRNGHGRIGTFRQALAESVVAEVEIPTGSKVKFTSYPLAQPPMAEKRWVLLQPDDQDCIEVEFTNRPEESVGIEHFAMFYNLNDPVPTEQPIPSRCLITGNGHANGNGPAPVSPPAQHDHSAHGHAIGALYFANPEACPFVQYP